MFMCNQTKVNGKNSPLQYNKTGFYHTHTLRVYGGHIHTPYDSPQCEFSLCSVTCCTKLIYTVATDYQAPSQLSTYPSYKTYTGETLTKAHRYTLSDVLSHLPPQIKCVLVTARKMQDKAQIKPRCWDLWVYESFIEGVRVFYLRRNFCKFKCKGILTIYSHRQNETCHHQ